jgi:hypothetical protein
MATYVIAYAPSLLLQYPMSYFTVAFIACGSVILMGVMAFAGVLLATSTEQLDD